VKVLVLGAGKMVGAFLEGISHSQDLSNWMIYSPTGISAKNLAVKFNMDFIQDLGKVPLPDLILVGCKPQQLANLKQLIGERFNECLFLSLLAAVSEKNQLNILKAKRLIRIMPNLSIAVNRGVILASSESAPKDLVLLKDLLSAIGKTIIVSDSELDELTLLTGSGPALFFYLAQNLVNSFDSLDSDFREDILREVLIGAGALLDKNNKKFSQLITEVSSKGGVTGAILTEWNNSNFPLMVSKGIRAGLNRANSINSGLSKPD
jgi:pyrroline-5-carboxylate reductase